MDRITGLITGTVIGAIGAGEAIGTAEGTAEDTAEGTRGTKKIKQSGRIPPRECEVNARLEQL